MSYLFLGISLLHLNFGFCRGGTKKKKHSLRGKHKKRKKEKKKEKRKKKEEKIKIKMRNNLPLEPASYRLASPPQD